MEVTQFHRRVLRYAASRFGGSNPREAIAPSPRRLRCAHRAPVPKGLQAAAPCIIIDAGEFYNGGVARLHGSHNSFNQVKPLADCHDLPDGWNGNLSTHSAMQENRAQEESITITEVSHWFDQCDSKRFDRGPGPFLPLLINSFVGDQNVQPQATQSRQTRGHVSSGAGNRVGWAFSWAYAHHATGRPPSNLSNRL